MNFLKVAFFVIVAAVSNGADQVQYQPQYSIARGIVAAPVSNPVVVPQYQAQIAYRPISIGLRTLASPSIGLTQIPVRQQFRLVPVGVSNGIGLNSGLGFGQGFINGGNTGLIGGGWTGLQGISGFSGLSGLGGWSGLDGIDFIKKKK